MDELAGDASEPRPSARETAEFLKALRVQKKVLTALILRELKTRFRVGTSRIGYLWVVLESVGFLVVFTGGFALMHADRISGIPVVPFLITGFVPFLVFQHVAFQCLYGIDANRGLLVYSQVKPLDVMIARSVLEIATYLVVFFIVLGGAIALQLADFPDDPVGLIVDIGLSGALGFGVGLIVSSMNVRTAIAETGFLIVSRVMFVVSGEFYVPDSLAPRLRDLVIWNPLAVFTESARGSYTSSFMHSYGSYVYAVACVVILTFVGLLMERASRRHIELV
jgi:capsular polysaccharide transport system permease protein